MIGRHAMAPCARLCLSVLALAASVGAHAQTSIRTETIRPVVTAAPAEQTAEAAGGPNAHLPTLTATPEIVTDLAHLPAAVARTREQILAAARTGDLETVAALMRASTPIPIFSFGDPKDPAAFWKANYPDSDGIEVLSILVTILELGYVHLEPRTAQELYVWPYFVGVPIKTLSPPQKVELFRVLTGADYKDMSDFGAYAFYRVGISPDGVWRFFVAGD
jgi:hypothetical protein